MPERPRDPARPYGWREFDPEVVEGLVENDSRFINRRASGWIACPLSGHYDDRLPWREDNFRKGSIPCGDPPASFRAAPTYVLENPLDNIIAGRELIAGAIAGMWGKTEAGRLGNETSEGALTWNVLRSLQEAGRLDVALRALAGIEGSPEPEPIFWGRHVAMSESHPWAELQRVRDRLEPGQVRQTEPDACLRVPGFGWVLIDARFGGSAAVLDDPSQVEAWLARYGAACPGVFDEEAIRSARLRELPERLLRTIAFAHTLTGEGEHAMVVALVRASDAADVEKWVGRCLAETADVGFRRATWESVYRGLDPGDARLEPLRLYLENKSYGLRPAFALQDDPEQPAER